MTCFVRSILIPCLSRPVLPVLLFILLSFTARAQQTITLAGAVRDSLSHLPLPNVTVYIGSTGTRTDASGKYQLDVALPATVRFLLTGYKIVTIKFTRSNYNLHTVIDLPRSVSQLEDVTVSTRFTGRYSNKNNPAVELIRQVIAHKDQNDIGAYLTASFNKYEKLCMYLDKFPHWVERSKLLKKYRFVFDNKDTTKVPGKELTPVFIEEVASSNYYRRHPEKTKTIITGIKKLDYGEFIDTRGLSTIFNRLYEDINIYDNHIVLCTRQFTSPISDAGPAVYKYFIRDTIVDNNQRFVQLFFMPRNNADLLFSGTMYVTLDGNYAVQKINMQTGRHINLGVIRHLQVAQQFAKDTVGKYHLNYSNAIADFGLTPGGSGMYGERTVRMNNFVTDIPLDDSLFKGWSLPGYDTMQSVTDKNYWNNHRPDSLSTAEAATYRNIDSLRHLKSYYRALDYFTLATSGYKTFGPVEVGPVASFLSYNPVEGYKPRIGGRTNTHFSTRYYLDGYAAYGSRDHELKYFGRVSYALNNKSAYTYPLHLLRFSYRNDTNIPGVSDEYVEENLFLSIKSGINDRYLYNHIFRADYIHELGDHLSLAMGLKYREQQPGGSLTFVKQNYTHNDTISSLTTGEVSFQVRWAPHEQFYQTKIDRVTVNNRYPVLTLNFTQGIKGLMGGEYQYSNINMSIFKRFYVAPLGVSDVTVSGGYLTGRLPWPLLIIHSGNQGFAYSGSAFNKMNYLEFVSDHYVSVALDHAFKGFFFNKIPLLKKMKLRETLNAKILFGGLRNENKEPYSIYHFPLTDGKIQTYSLGSTPYVEAGAGISNIFKVLRLDAIRRFTYLDHPGVNKWAIRALFHVEL
ncbi:DUF5686 family protein [Deminuibacter soli]|uniref:Carboxypeptidase-like regulatory domain-containing protein n=1 Tax=Deminuibacter soli TaxID=2291815 RepID=A0A3E1NI80_9BACT|nr:DUF5686 family protein [Deminuibacter soli]RFM27630.1 carboxypeptidase-like regulatory domain-containing protein [Deminuibacter soli]